MIYLVSLLFGYFVVTADWSVLVDGRFIIQHMLEPTKRIQSIDDPVKIIEVEKAENREKPDQ